MSARCVRRPVQLAWWCGKGCQKKAWPVHKQKMCRVVCSRVIQNTATDDFEETSSTRHSLILCPPLRTIFCLPSRRRCARLAAQDTPGRGRIPRHRLDLQGATLSSSRLSTSSSALWRRRRTSVTSAKTQCTLTSYVSKACARSLWTRGQRFCAQARGLVPVSRLNSPSTPPRAERASDDASTHKRAIPITRCARGLRSSPGDGASRCERKPSARPTPRAAPTAAVESTTRWLAAPEMPRGAIVLTLLCSTSPRARRARRARVRRRVEVCARGSLGGAARAAPSAPAPRRRRRPRCASS